MDWTIGLLDHWTIGLFFGLFFGRFFRPFFSFFISQCLTSGLSYNSLSGNKVSLENKIITSSISWLMNLNSHWPYCFVRRVLTNNK